MKKLSQKIKDEIEENLEFTDRFLKQRGVKEEGRNAVINDFRILIDMITEDLNK